MSYSAVSKTVGRVEEMIAKNRRFAKAATLLNSQFNSPSRPDTILPSTLLFYFDYLNFLSNFGFREQALVVFDHLSPTIAEYISRSEFEQWFEDNNLSDVIITSRTGNSWRGFGIRR